MTAAATLAAGTGALLWQGDHSLSAGVLLTGAALAAGAIAGRMKGGSPFGAREASMAIVPWGVLVNPDTEPRVLRWPAIRAITVDVAHTMRGGTPAILSSVVTVDTGRERLTGRTSGNAGLEALVANLEAYAEESSLPVALDLDGTEPAGATEPVMADLVTRAEELRSTSRGATALALPPRGYRSMANSTAGPETIALLRSILVSGADHDERADKLADARPLAAIVAAHLGARALVPELLRLVSAPHPVVAAVAKAAALRLGAPQSRAGAIDEVAAFLFDEDLERIERWASGD
jgi:hypothetical protein